jgi:uncharacterized protein (DUF433 family)
VPIDVVMNARLTYAAHSLNGVIEISADRGGGLPVLAGTRFTISRIIAELADGMSVSKLSREFNLDKKKISELLHGIAIIFDRPFSR